MSLSLRTDDPDDGFVSVKPHTEPPADVMEPLTAPFAGRVATARMTVAQIAMMIRGFDISDRECKLVAS